MTTNSIGIFSQFQSRLAARDLCVGVIGLGYVGLPLARAFAGAKVKTVGFDLDSKKVAALTARKSYIRQIPDAAIAAMREQGFTATVDLKTLGVADAILICVPTPLTSSREPDLTYVVDSTKAIAAALRPGQLIILESTTYPTTTRDVVLPILKSAGLRIGEEVFLAYSPEREDPGNPNHSVSTIPKVVGGYDAKSADLACALYEMIAPHVVRVSSLDVAEACKILENTYRSINIALVNEMKVLFDRMGIDIWEVINAAKTKPFGFQAFYPGPGLGGHCIPIDPFYLTWVARQYGLTTRFIELAGEINTSMPAYVISRLVDALNERKKPVKGSRILLLGMAYKKDVDDPRESPGFELLELLLSKGASVSYNDPFIPLLPRMRHYPQLEMVSQPLSPEILAGQDCVLIATDHSQYDYAWIVKHSPLVIDSRNATSAVAAGREKIVKA